MWTVLILLNLGALHCAASSSLPSPINVTFSSINLRNELRWFPGSGTPDGTHFTVQYAIYGDSVEGKGRRVHWRAVLRCTEIARSRCDLSEETWDLEQGYHARVRAVSRRASSKWALTRRRFDPKTDTSFGPPLVSVEIEDNNAMITLKGPMRYQPNNHTPAVSMATLYPQMTYNLSIDNTRYSLIHHFPVFSSSYKYRLMDYNTEYCFSANTRFFSMPTHCQASAWLCLTTPQDPVIGQIQRLVVGIVVASVCMCMLVAVGYLLYRYLTGKGQKSPYILHPPAFHPPVLTFPPENPKLLLITIIKDLQPRSSTSDPACSKRPRHVAQPPPGYASQSPGPLPEPEEPWDDLSVDYGFIAAGDDIRREGGKSEARHTYETRKGRAEDGHPAAHTQTHTQTEMDTLLRAHAWSQPTQTPLISLLGEVNGEEEDGEVQGLLPVPLNQTKKEVEEVDGKVGVRTDGGVEERSENEEVPLLSAYASQNSTDTSDPTGFLPGDYGVVRQEAEEDEEEKGTNCVDWDPETRKLVLPQMALEFKKDGGWEGWMQGGREGENGMGGEEEEEGLRLENVFVRQGSEENAEGQRAMGRGGGTGWEAEDFLTRWNLVISMDQ